MKWALLIPPNLVDETFIGSDKSATVLNRQSRGFSLAVLSSTDAVQHIPQNRHPERSASQTYRVTSACGAESEEPVPSVAEGTPAMLILPVPLGVFGHRSPGRGQGEDLFIRRDWGFGESVEKAFPFHAVPDEGNLLGHLTGSAAALYWNSLF